MIFEKGICTIWQMYVDHRVLELRETNGMLESTFHSYAVNSQSHIQASVYQNGTIFKLQTSFFSPIPSLLFSPHLLSI
jgi:hypothetical protein